MLPIARTPDNSNFFRIPSKVWVIKSRLYFPLFLYLFCSTFLVNRPAIYYFYGLHSAFIKIKLPRLSLGEVFPPHTTKMTLRYFIENTRKIEPKELPSCLIPCPVIACSAASLNLCESLRSNREKEVTDDDAVEQWNLGFLYLLKWSSLRQSTNSRQSYQI